MRLSFRPALLAHTILAGALLLAAPQARAAVTYIGSAQLAANLTDLSGLTGLLEDGTAQNQLGSFGSGIAYNGLTGTFFATPDRGPNASTYNPAVDNTTSYQSRIEEFRFNVTLGAGLNGAGGSVAATLLSTRLLTNGGAALNGLSSDFANRFDPEAIRVGRHGDKVYISDEYGPALREFDAATGQQLRAFTMPAGFTIATPNAVGANELPPGNTTGRQANRGAESLAISPDGKKLFLATQNPLIQDGALTAANNRRGVNIRIVQFDIATGLAEKQFLYVLGDGTTNAPNGGRSLGINDMVAINDHELLIVERDGAAGSAAVVKRIVAVDLTGATDISAIANLPQTGLPPGVIAVTKSTFIDLLDPAFGLAGTTFPEKIEGLAFGADLSDGRHTLFVTSDNDFLPNNPSQILAFAIDPRDLNFVPQDVPEPATLALLGMGLAGLVAARRRRR